MGVVMNEIYEEFKEQVRAQADIVKIVSEYVALKKKGSRYWGCCPFHSEKTASFSVTQDKGLFHCFGCNAGGDVFNFIMKIENCSFPEATKALANKLGIPIPEKQKNQQELEREKAAKQIFDTNALGVKFFQSCLLNTEYGKAALKYLSARGISSATIETFSLGLAPPGYHTLHSALSTKGVSEELMVQAGLVGKGDSGRLYDRFRGRVMIPIKDARGRVVGFTGRVLDSEAKEAKYVNTSETEWFTKRSILFGLDAALKAIKEHKQVIVVEGHMDAISLHAAGINWAVASMGTAFSVQHAHLIARLAAEVVFSFDSDTAGINAALRSIAIAQKEGLTSRVVIIPDGKDPDDFVRKHGKVAYLQLVKEAIAGIDFQIEQTLKENNINDLAGKVKTVSNILPFLLECKNDIEIAQRIRNLAQRLTIDEGLILSEYRKVSRTSRLAQGSVIVNRENNTRRLSAADQAERHLLFAIIKNREAAQEAMAEIFAVGFNNTLRNEIFLKVRELVALADQHLEADLFASLSEAASAELALILNQDLTVEMAKLMISDCLKQLRRAWLERDFEKHRMLADKYEREGDDRFLQELAESQRIKNELNKLF